MSNGDAISVVRLTGIVTTITQINVLSSNGFKQSRGLSRRILAEYLVYLYESGKYCETVYC
jgi:hypothetical protein